MTDMETPADPHIPAEPQGRRTGRWGKPISFLLCSLVVLCMILVHGWAEVLNARAGNPFENMPVRRWRVKYQMNEEIYRRIKGIRLEEVATGKRRELTAAEKDDLAREVARLEAYNALCDWADVASLLLLAVPLVIVWSVVMTVRGPLWRRLASPLLILLAIAYFYAYAGRFTLD
jgi:hypothetical protein